MSLQLGVQPFWFWNGEMNDSEVRRQIQEMHSQGIRGFMIHPRQGMEIPYLSETFFEKAKAAVEIAESLGMEVWLYDEYPYPSGTSGGKVMLDHPEYCCKELKRTVQDVGEGQTVRLEAPWGRVLMARAYRVRDGQCLWDDFIPLEAFIGTGYSQEVFQLSGLTAYNKKRFFTGDPCQLLQWTPPEGQWRIHIYTECLMQHFKYFETFVDPLNPDAIRYYLETTHEKYREYLGNHFGKTVKGIFTDETTAFPPLQPWSPLLPELVKNLHGIDLISCLPALFEDMGSKTAAIRYAYWNAATEGFIHSYDKQIYDWCEKNQLLYIGEKPILRSKQLAYMHIPGIDAGHQKVGSKAVFPGVNYRANGKIVSSAAHFYNKPAALCEAYHSIGWGMTLQDMKWILDWLTVSGVDWLVVHGFFYTTDALKKHDAPASAFYQMPWWRDTHLLTAYADSLASFLRDTKRDIRLLVMDPATSSWTGDSSLKKQLGQDFAELQQGLIHNQTDYYIADPQLFATGKVEEINGVTSFVIGSDRFSCLLLPLMTNLEACALEPLEAYLNKGGQALAFGCLPFEDIGTGSPAPLFSHYFGVSPMEQFTAYLAGDRNTEAVNGACLYTSSLTGLLSHLKRLLPPKGEVLPSGSPDIVSVYGSGRDGEERLFIVNLSQNPQTVSIRLGGREGKRELAAFESAILTGESLEVSPQDTFRFLPDDYLFSVELHRENALRIGTWEMTLDDGQTANADSFPLIDQLEQAGLKITVCQRPYFGCPKELAFPATAASYRYSFLNRLPQGSQVWLVMEPGTLLGRWTMAVNGHTLSQEHFIEHAFYLPTNLAVDITAYLLPGTNLLTLELSSDLSFGGIRNPLYLMGDFGVFREDGLWTLSPFEPQRKASIKDPLSFGIPFYAGRVSFTAIASVLPSQLSCEQLFIDDPWLEDSVSLTVNGCEAGTIAWSPYRFALPQGCLKPGGNTIEMQLDTTLIGLFEGQHFNRDTHSYESY